MPICPDIGANTLAFLQSYSATTRFAFACITAALARCAISRIELPDFPLTRSTGLASTGFVAGVAIAIKSKFPNSTLMTAEPEGFEDHAHSFASGKREHGTGKGTTLCDALMAPNPGELTFSINRHLVAAGAAASDAEVGEAMKVAFRELKLVVEPGGAAAFATLLAGHLNAKGKTVAIVLSGGNVDADLYAKLIV